MGGLAGSCRRLVSLRLTTGIEHQRARVFWWEERRHVRQILRFLVCENHECGSVLHSLQMCMYCAHAC